MAPATYVAGAYYFLSLSNILKIIKVLVSIALLVVLALRVDWSQVLREASAMAWWTVMVAILLQASSFVWGNLRWWAILRTHELELRFVDLLPQYFIGGFFNNLLPTSTGGDLFRMYYMYKRGHGAALVASPIIVERVVGLVILIGMAVVVLPFIRADAEIVHGLRVSFTTALLIILTALLLLRWRRTYWPIHNFFERWSRIKAIRALLNIAEAVHQYLQISSLVWLLVLFTLLLQLGEVVLFFLLGYGLGSDMPFTAYLVMVPVVFVVASLPITVGGLGVREIAVVTLFTAAGMSEAHAATIALLFIPILLIASLPGLVFFLLQKDHKQMYQQATRSDLAG